MANGRIMNLMFMGPCIALIFWHIIPTRYTIHRVYFYLKLLYMFRALLSPIAKSTKQLTTASGNHYTVIDRVRFTDRGY
jgi:hypothetical protein